MSAYTDPIWCTSCGMMVVACQHKPLAYIPTLKPEPSRLTWTTDRPSAAGWFWVEWGGGSRTCERVEESVREPGVLCIGRFLLPEVTGAARWAGPIPEPEEPTT